MQVPKIEGKVVLFHKSDPMAQDHFSDLRSETGFFLILLVDNTGQRIINLRSLENEQKKILYPIIDKNIMLNKDNIKKMYIKIVLDMY